MYLLASRRRACYELYLVKIILTHVIDNTYVNETWRGETMLRDFFFVFLPIIRRFLAHYQSTALAFF